MPVFTSVYRQFSRLKCLCGGILISSLALGWQGCSPKDDPQAYENSFADFFYQYSIISALQAGVFDGNQTFGELKKKGDFGVGTFNRVDGELFINQGKMYRIRSNGSIAEVADRDSTSLAFVKFFKPDSSFTVQSAGITLEQLQSQIAAKLPANELFAVRIKGQFSKLTARVPAAARKPYPTLSEHLAKTQVLFELTNTTGVAVGFLVPTYMDKVNVPGFHFHYLADDLKAGGHVYNFTATQVTVEIDRAKGYYVEQNANADFLKVKL